MAIVEIAKTFESVGYLSKEINLLVMGKGSKPSVILQKLASFTLYLSRVNLLF